MKFIHYSGLAPFMAILDADIAPMGWPSNNVPNTLVPGDPPGSYTSIYGYWWISRSDIIKPSM